MRRLVCVESPMSGRSLQIETQATPATEQQGHGPDTAAIIACLLMHRKLIESCGMIYLIVDNRAPEEVEHWPAFAQWWAARRALVGPQQERTDVLWVQATHANGLRAVPYYWAGVFVLEAARFLFPKVHFGLVDNDCVPVTLFEVQDLMALAESQFRWPDLTGYRADPDLAKSKPGMLLFTEAHLEYNAGLVISIGSPNRPSPIEATSTAENLAEELEDYRQQLLAMAAPPECPTEASQGGSLFTPLIGVPMEHSLDLAVVWALFGTYMCYQFWPMPVGACSGSQHPSSIKWPKRAHPGALTDAGQERTPWLTSWARATFEQGCLSVLPHLEGPCKAISLPGEHLFQASRIAPDLMRPVIFHAFGKAKLDAHDQLARLARLGWETLPIALLGMPNYPAAWSQEAWKPIGGCCFTGGPIALTGNSAFRFCLLLRWHAISVPSTALFSADRQEEVSDVESVRAVSETNQSFLERSLLAAVADQNSRESGSSPSGSQQHEEQSSRGVSCRPTNPQMATPALFVPRQEVATQVGIPVEHEAFTDDLRTMFNVAIGALTVDEQREFRQLQGAMFCQIPRDKAPVETTASLVLGSMYEVYPWVPHWEKLLWHMAQSHRFWLTAPKEPLPDI